MKYPEDVRKDLLKKYHNRHRDWLIESDEENSWPLVISLGIPTEHNALRQLNDLRAWTISWQDWQGSGQLIYSTKHWKKLSLQRLPSKLILATVDDVMQWIGESSRWQRAKNRYQLIIAQWPVLVEIISRHFDILADYDDENFNRLCNLLAWIEKNPHSNLYLRQLPIAGLDSKWLEKRKKIVGNLISEIRNDKLSGNNFYQLCGLKEPAKLLRIRLLDQTLRNCIGGLDDISVPLGNIAQLQLPITRVIIVENLQTGLSFTDTPGTIVFMKLGYSVDLLGQIPWLLNLKCYYWGDIDTHGFAILDRLRHYLPQAQSVLMNEKTLLNHKILWGKEDDQHPLQELTHLNDTEQSVYQKLKQHHWQHNLRLEQERIDWDYAMKHLETAIEW